jgi:hypothetical protein
MGRPAQMNALSLSQLIDAATEATGLDDFGSASWSEGLERLVEALKDEAALNERGIVAAGKELKYHLVARLGIVAHRKGHPEVADAGVTPPLIIVGQARTGTTILHELFAHDPAARAPLTWEVERPCPPPESATYATDPRIDAVNARISAVGKAMPELFAMHPMGAQLGQECVCITASDFRSVLFATEYRVPSYARWLFGEADHGSAYQWHRIFLQHLQSRHPTDRWVLKSPGHIWNLGALLNEYPEALLVQTHRDPLRIIASVTSMYTTLRATTSDAVDPREIAAEWAEYIITGLDRSVSARQDGTVAPDQVVDINFKDFVGDQIGSAARIYEKFGLNFTDATRARASDFLAEHPRERHGGHRYTFAATGLDEGEWRERARNYMDYFDVPSEGLD